MGACLSNPREFKEYFEDVVLESIYPLPDDKVIKSASRRPTKPARQNVQTIESDAKLNQRKNESVVNASDGRTQVLETAKWPNSVHGLLFYKVNNIPKWGTGILIGPHVVLTAGHNLYDYETKTFIDEKSLQFLPGMNGQVLPFGLVEAEKHFVSPSYIKDGKEDYGVVILKKPIGEVTGYFGLVCLEPEEIKAKKINITGYPSDKVASKPKMYEMWGMGGKASHIDKEKGEINYLIDTAAGQSGSGVWYQEGEDYYVCGVHVAGTSFVNTATLLTRNMYKQIFVWAHQGDFKESSLELRSTKKLQFFQRKINPEDVSLLMKYNLNIITTLDFLECSIGEEEAKELAKNTSWINLSKLDLCYNKINAEGAKALAQNATWINLSRLYLSANNIGAEGAKALAQNTSWTNLLKLNLLSNKIGDKGVKALAQNTSWINLSELNLSANNIGAEGAKALAQNTSWIKLSILDLSSNNIGAEGAKGLAQNTSWVNLSELLLDKNNIRDEGIKALTQNTSWVNLSKLSFCENELNVKEFVALNQNKTWKQPISVRSGSIFYDKI